MKRVNRPSKKDIVTIDDDGEPEVKKLVPPEVAEVQEQLRNLEAKFQRLLTICGEKQARIELLEGIVDKKPDISANPQKVEELEKRIVDLTKEMVEMRNRAIDDQKRALEDRMRDAEKIAQLTAKLAHFELRSLQQVQQGQLQKPEAKSLQQSRAMLQGQLQIRKPEATAPLMMQKEGEKEKGREEKETGEEEQQLGEKGEKEEEVVKPQSDGIEEEEKEEELKLHQLDSDEEVSETGSDVSLVLYEEDDPINIFRLCDPDMENSVSVPVAKAMIREKMDECREMTFRRYMGYTNERLGCEICECRIRASHILLHFIDTHHEERARKGAVSSNALQYWLQMLEKAKTDAGAAPMREERRKRKKSVSDL